MIQRVGAIDLREVGDVLHEQDQRREERVQRHAGEQQHRRGHRAVLHRRQPVDDARRRSTAPARLASGTAENGPALSDAPKTIASMAPSDAPADTPSVNGVASGLRSSA